MKKLLFSVIASACCLASVGQVSHAVLVDTDIASYPLYVSSGLCLVAIIPCTMRHITILPTWMKTAL